MSLWLQCSEEGQTRQFLDFLVNFVKPHISNLKTSSKSHLSQSHSSVLIKMNESVSFALMEAATRRKQLRTHELKSEVDKS